jgi:hypothetical protein
MAGRMRMPPASDDDIEELSESLIVTDELQHGMAVLRRRLKAIKLSLPKDETPGSVGVAGSEVRQARPPEL